MFDIFFKKNKFNETKEKTEEVCPIIKEREELSIQEDNDSNTDNSLVVLSSPN